ncbi:MAG: efflux RND transporter periplasmic adaptor subunit, partial [Verrucomicrobia bacterium]|nr:efflux RND transporter periplasmic adaptor subunit [Verrucomicrobiota bacterium]
VAKANLERIQTLADYTKITAPFSGVVTARHVDPGAFIPAATSGSAAQTAAVVTVMDFSTVRVQVPVTELEAPLVAVGQPVKVSVEGLPGRVFDGKVTRHAYALDDATKTMLAEAEILNAKLELRPGMYAMIKVGVEKHNDALLIPVEGLLVERAGASVFLFADGKAKKTAVKTGFNDGAKVEILGGLTGNERVLLFGKMTLNDGQAINAVEAR